jgi:biopolymer transport protein ExbD
MSMNVASADAEDPINSEINTTPLVDIMLVLLIIFLVTIPVIIKSVQITLPVASNIVTVTKPENIVIGVDKEGNFYWNDAPVPSTAELFEKLKLEAVKVPQPEVHIRGDVEARFENVGRVLITLQRSAILKVGFITNPEPRVF